MVMCSILGCKNRKSQKAAGITFHVFPLSPEIKKKWIEATGRQNWEPSKYSTICSIHFETNSFICTPKFTHLIPSSVPNKCIYNPSASEYGSAVSPKVRRAKKTKSTVHLTETDKSDASRTDDESDKLLRHDDNSQQTSLTVETDVGRGLPQECYYCNGCSNIIKGFRYICVQCKDVDFCSSCEARGVHELHYMLRVPGARPEEEISSILQKIREELSKYENKITNTVQSIKIEIEEIPDPMDVVENVYIDVPVSMDNRPIKVESELTSSDANMHTDRITSKKRCRAKMEEHLEDQNAVSHINMKLDSAVQNSVNIFDHAPHIKIEVDVSEDSKGEVFVHNDVEPLTSGLNTMLPDLFDPGKVTKLATRTNDVMTDPGTSIKTHEPHVMTPQISRCLVTKAGRQFLEITCTDRGRNEHELRED